MIIVSNKVHNDLNMQMLYKAYYTSREFQISLLNIFKLDVLYSQNEIIFSSFDKVFSGTVLNAEEYSVVKRVLSDEYVIASLAQTFSDADYEVFMSKIQTLPLEAMHNFHYPLEQFQQENKEVIMAYIISQFLMELKNDYISHISAESVIGLESIISGQSPLSQAELDALNQSGDSESTHELQKVLINHGIVPPPELNNKLLDEMCYGQAREQDIKI